MSWNNGYEYRKFLKEMERNRKMYQDAGMCEDQINTLIAYDTRAFREERIYRSYVQSYDVFSADMEEAERSPLLLRFLEQMSTEMDYSSMIIGSNWVDQIEDDCLRNSLQKLDGYSAYVLYRRFVENDSMEALARMVNCSPCAVHQTIDNALKKLRDWMQRESQKKTRGEVIRYE